MKKIKNCNNCGDINCAAHGDGEQFSCKNWESRMLDTTTKSNEVVSTAQKQPRYIGKPMGLLRKTSDRFNDTWRRKHDR